MTRVLAFVRRRRAVLGAASAFALLAGLAATTPGAFGAYSAKITNSADTAASATWFQCVDALGADKSTALFQWPLGESANTVPAADISGAGHTGTYQGSVVADSTTPLGCPRDTGTAWKLDGTSSYAYYPTQQTNPQVFTIEVWFKTTVAGGKLIGFGANATGASSTYDRHLYMTTTGAISFGVYSSGTHIITSTSGSFADGKWHHAAATLSSAGMVLYLDGKVAGTNTTTVAESGNGYWRVGYDSISTSWASPQTATYFKGSLRYAAVYTSALSAAQIARHAAAGS